MQLRHHSPPHGTGGEGETGVDSATDDTPERVPAARAGSQANHDMTRDNHATLISNERLHLCAPYHSQEPAQMLCCRMHCQQ